MIIIDGVRYEKIGVLSLKRKGEFLDKYAERTADGVLQRELIGVYINYQLQITSDMEMEEYNALWDVLTAPEKWHTVTVPSKSGGYTYTAYFSNVADEARIVENGIAKFDNLTVNFIATRPARTPTA